MENSWQRWKNIMKCYPFEEKRLAKWQPPYIVQPKYDGIRCRAIPSLTQIDNNYLLVTSEENILYSVPHINSALSTFRFQAEFDGELYIHKENFETIVSITKRTVNLHPQYTRVEFHIFDIVNELPQMRRTILLENLRNIHPSIKVAPFWLCESLDEITSVYDKIIEQGYEGIIVRHCDAPYERKRSTFVMKFKPKKEDEYKILGCVEEISQDGTPKGRLGSLVCDSGDGLSFNVGTGFSADQRASLWEIRGMLPGMVCKIKYQHLTTGRKVPRFPVFVELLP